MLHHPAVLTEGDRGHPARGQRPAVLGAGKVLFDRRRISASNTTPSSTDNALNGRSPANAASTRRRGAVC
jgi:hypothetical protein